MVCENDWVHHGIWAVFHYLKALDFLNACQVYAVECVTKIKYIP